MKTKILILLLFTFSMTSCYTDDVNSDANMVDEDLQTHFDSNQGNSKTLDPPAEFTSEVIDVYYNTDLTTFEIKAIRDYYFSKYDKDHEIVRLEMFDPISTDSYHEQWLKHTSLSWLMENEGGEDPLDREMAEDPDIRY